MKIKQEIIDKVLDSEVLIAKIAEALKKEGCEHCKKDIQTIKKWLKTDSLMLRLFPVYNTIQIEMGLTDKELFTTVK